MDLATLMASLRLVLQGCNDLQLTTAVALVRAALTDELKDERTREMAAARKRRQRDKGRDSERDITVTDGVTVTLVPPSPPSGSLSSDPIRSPDLSEPDPEKSESDEPLPLTRYSSNFVEFWNAYPRKVGKDAAWRAWKAKCPPLPACMSALLAQRQSRQWRDGIICNPATWINQGRWKDETGHQRDIGVTASVTSSPLEAYCDWHRTPGNDERASHRPKSTCPSCKHLTAKGSHRPGGVSAISDLDDPLPDWAERRAP